MVGAWSASQLAILSKPSRMLASVMEVLLVFLVRCIDNNGSDFVPAGSIKVNVLKLAGQWRCEDRCLARTFEIFA